MSFSAFNMALKGSMAPSICSSASGNTFFRSSFGSRCVAMLPVRGAQVVNASRVRFFETPEMDSLCGTYRPFSILPVSSVWPRYALTEPVSPTVWDVATSSKLSSEKTQSAVAVATSTLPHSTS